MIDSTERRSAPQEEESSGSAITWDEAVQELDVKMAILDRHADWPALVHLLKQRNWQVGWQEQDTVLMVRTT